MLGVHRMTVPKMVRRGLLTPRPGRRPSLSRKQVLDLKAVREAAANERARERTALPPAPAGPRAPDDEHDWILAPAAAAVLECTPIALQGRCVRGQVPYVVHDGRRWFRLDLLELQVRARAARAQHRVTRIKPYETTSNA